MVFNKPLFITDRRRKLQKKQTRLLLQYNVIELIFQRRIWPVKGKRMRFGKPTPVRRMLCTADWKFLQDHKREFDYKRPSFRNGRSERWYRQRNLAIVWDLILNRWRMVNLDDYRIMNSFPLETEGDQQQFIEKFTSMKKRKGINTLMRLLNK